MGGQSEPSLLVTQKVFSDGDLVSREPSVSSHSGGRQINPRQLLQRSSHWEGERDAQKSLSVVCGC